MKYNLGSGTDFRFGWLNVDRQPEVAPDVVWDLGVFPWPFADGSADEVAIINLLDEMPQAVLPRFMRELYRICRSDTKVTIRATDPRHDDAALAPPGGGLASAALQSYDLAINEDWIARGLHRTPSALYAEVDFATVATQRVLDARWIDRWRSGGLGEEALTAAMQGQNNVLAASEVVLKARKPFEPGVSLRQADALVLVRFGGLGDVLMALAACQAIKSVVDRPIYLVTAPAYRDFAALCPFLDHAVCDEASLAARSAAAGHRALKVVDLSPVRFGGSRLHQVDAYLQALSLAPPDEAKGLAIDLSRVPAGAAAARLAALPTGSKRIVLHPGLSDPNRTWPAAFWAEVADHCLAAGHCVVTIGRSRAEDGRGVATLADPRIVDLTDVLDLAGSLQVLRCCDLLISADSGPVQLAGASDIGIIGLYSVVGGEKRLPYRHGSRHHRAVALGPECAFSPCYRWMSDPDTYAEFARQRGLAGDDVGGIYSRWCVNADSYACTREPSMLDKVKSVIPGLLWQGEAGLRERASRDARRSA